MLLKHIFTIMILTNFETCYANSITGIPTSTQGDDDFINFNAQEVQRLKAFLKSISYLTEQATRLKDPNRYCRSFHTCYECVKSLWYPCGWCHDHGCTDRTDKYCPINLRKAEKYNLTIKTRTCPQIQNNEPVLISAGTNINIQAKVYIPNPEIYEKEITCQIKMKKRIMHLIGIIIGDTVYCYGTRGNPDTFKFEDTETGTLELIWGGAQPYSNEVPLIVYKCEDLAMNCEACRLIPPEYGCGWCDRTHSCVIGQNCHNDWIQWTLNRLTCDTYVKDYYLSKYVGNDDYLK